MDSDFLKVVAMTSAALWEVNKLYDLVDISETSE
jgi:hypothetical protein